MSVEAPVPKDHPLMVAWAARKATQDHANNARWAVVPEHTTGALWGEFVAGWEAATPAEVAALRAEVERLRGALEAIERSHVPSQPATAAGSDFEWAMMHVGNLRRIARAALAHKEPPADG